MPSRPDPRTELRRERFTRHALSTRSRTSVVGATAVTSAVQAQDNQAARLGLRSRASGLLESDVVAAIETDRTIARTWLMRGTIHQVDTADLRWLVRLIGPNIQRRYRTRWRQLGLSDEVLGRSVDALPEILADGPLNRHEIRAALAERGVTLDSPDPQVHTHAVVHASTTGLICRGPDRGRHSTFALTDRWVPDAPEGPSGDDALAELARRYFAAYSPATAADFATWSGLGSSRAIELIRDELTPVDVDGTPGFRRGVVEPARGLRLLPAFDNYVLGYRDRDAILPTARHPLVYQGGMIRPTVVDDGLVLGVWGLERARRVARVTVTPFATLTRRITRDVEAEVADLARFLGRDVDVVISAPSG